MLGIIAWIAIFGIRESAQLVRRETNEGSTMADVARVVVHLPKRERLFIFQSAAEKKQD